MRICLVSIGSRGDMEPFLAVGELLKKRGHEVSYIFPAQFKPLADDINLPFYSLGEEFIELLFSEDGKKAMGGASNFWQKLMAYVKLAKLFKATNKKMIFLQKQWIDQIKPDLIIYSPKSVYPLIWSLQPNHKAINLSPVPYTLHRVINRPHIGFNFKGNTLLNKLTYAIAEIGLTYTIYNASKTLKSPVSKRQIKQALALNPAIYTLSPNLFKRPQEWPDHVQVVGFHERNKTSHWQPSHTLIDFLTTHSKIVFITFGSMINPKPEEKTHLVLKALEQLKIPAIINVFNGGLEKPKGYQSENILFVNEIPYDWIFPKVYAVVHHGGSGTTHMATKYGCPSLIIPHIIDQFMWNKLIAENELGPLGPSITKINQQNFTESLNNLYNNNQFKINAELMGAKMKTEHLADYLYNLIISN